MSVLSGIFITAAPLLLAAAGALISEHTGALAIFIDGIINLSAFICFTITTKTNSIPLGIISAIVLCALFMWGISIFTVKTKSNPFLVALSINLLATGCISFFSQLLFNTRGVLFNPETFTNTKIAGFTGSIFSIVATGGLFIALKKSRWGTYTRITGSDPKVLENHGLNPSLYRHISWILAAMLASCAGCLLTLRLSSFVPNISAGRGWIALAAVFTGRKTGRGTLLSVLVFTIAEYASTALQGAQFINISPTILLSLPYFSAFILFALHKKNSQT